MHCFVDDFRAWLSNASGRETHPYGAAYPVTAASCPPPVTLEVKAPPPCPLVALEAFLNAPTWEADADAEGGAVARSPYGARWQADVGLARGTLHFLSVSFELQLRPSSAKKEAEAAYAAVLNFSAAYDALAIIDGDGGGGGGGVGGGGGPGVAMPSAGGVWVWMHGQQQLPSEAVLGSVRAACLALLVLLLLTQNIQLVGLAALTLLGATASLTACLVACRWALGSTEALLASITPALITPPTALVLRSYQQADAGGPPMKRSLRAAHAFSRCGAPVISGCVAISLCLAPLLACQLVDLFKFAVALSFIALCVGTWAGLLLPALLGAPRPARPHPARPPPPPPLAAATQPQPSSPTLSPTLSPSPWCPPSP